MKITDYISLCLDTTDVSAFNQSRFDVLNDLGRGDLDLYLKQTAIELGNYTPNLMPINTEYANFVHLVKADEYSRQCNNTLSVLKNFYSINYRGIAKCIIKDYIYYGNRNIILNCNFDPLLIIIRPLIEYLDTNVYSTYTYICMLSPRIFTCKNLPLERSLITAFNGAIQKGYQVIISPRIDEFVVRIAEGREPTPSYIEDKQYMELIRRNDSDVLF